MTDNTVPVQVNAGPGRLLVREVKPEEETTESGIIVPTGKKNMDVATTAVVISVGDWFPRWRDDVFPHEMFKPGDVVQVSGMDAYLIAEEVAGNIYAIQPNDVLAFLSPVDPIEDLP